MSFRLITVVNPARLSIKDGNLIIHTDMPHSIPVEDISVLILESRQITVSVYALSLLASEGVCVFTCNAGHIPDGVYTPFCTHTRRAAVLREQIAASQPLKKQLWKSIVTQKVRNQALCIEYCGFIEDEGGLYAMLPEIRSGDSSHVEAKAAAAYFRTLFGAAFSRRQENIINAALNYGYSIIRGAICRTVAGLGMEPSLGIFHRSELNAFNLADDLIEPFRPVVDMWAFCHIDSSDKELSSAETASLVSLLNCAMLINDKKQSLLYCIETLCESFVRSLNGKEDMLCLPQLTREELYLPKELRYGLREAKGE